MKRWVYPPRLGPKMHFWLVIFLLLLGGATASVVLAGFERSQDNATERSKAGLEDQGREHLEFFAAAQAQIGYLQFSSITAASQQAAKVMYDVQPAEPIGKWDAAHLVRGSGGQWYDANPARVTDVFIPNWNSPAATTADLQESAVLDSIFPALLAKFPGKARNDDFDAISVYFTSASGAIRYYPPDGFPERIEPDTAVNSGLELLGPNGNPERKTLWTAPYRDINGHGLVLTSRTPVYQGDVFKGVLGVDLSMTQLIRQLDFIQPTPSSFAFYIDSAGDLVQSRGAPEVRSEIEADNQDLRRVLDVMTWTTHGTERVTLEDGEVFISYATIPEVGGRLAVVAPVDELSTQAAAVSKAIDSEGNRTVGATLGVMGVFFFIALAGVTYINRRVLLRPIQAILSGTQEVAAGNLKAQIQVCSDDELGEVASSFNRMTGELAQAQHLLESRVEERTRELRALLDISRTMSQTMDPEELLPMVLDQLRLVIADYKGASLLILEGNQLVTREARGASGRASRHAIEDQRFPIHDLSSIWEPLLQGRAVIIDDVRGDSPEAETFREATGPFFDTVFAAIRGWCAVPIVVKERVAGMLAVSAAVPGGLTQHHADLAMAVATQAGIALENAYLLEQSGRSAALEERQRLARELHDSVSQALYGIALGARTARKRLDTDPTRLEEPLDYVLTLAEAGLTEMRALIFELRPDSIETEGLVAALGRQIAATQARYGVAVNASLTDEPDVPVGTKEALYRIAQEAMHNTVKHARAQTIDLLLERHNGHLHMRVHDDGKGFDPAAEFPGHLGLRSMRERMLAIGGTFEIASAPGEGTRITVTAPAGPASELDEDVAVGTPA